MRDGRATLESHVATTHCAHIIKINFEYYYYKMKILRIIKWNDKNNKNRYQMFNTYFSFDPNPNLNQSARESSRQPASQQASHSVSQLVRPPVSQLAIHPSILSSLIYVVGWCCFFVMERKINGKSNEIKWKKKIHLVIPCAYSFVNWYECFFYSIHWLSLININNL